MPPVLNIQAGYGEIEIVATAALPDSVANSSTTHEIAYTNGFTPTKPRYQVNTFTSGDTISLGTQNRDDDQQSLSVAFAIGAPVTSDTSTSDAAFTTTAASSSGWLGTLLDFVEYPGQSPTAFLLVFGLAIVLGGIHALTPGHGKTLVAAYLVGSKGTVKHAAALGATVTITHTASVIVIGLIALFASHLLLPGVLVPALRVFSGLLVVILGGRLVVQRWRAMRQAQSGIPAMSHAHAGTISMHRHGNDQLHSHAMPEGPLTGRNLLAMGFSGGLVPCPEALGIMILAVGLHHIALGLGLIVAFSIGLATILIAIGILLVRVRSVLDRVCLRGTQTQPWLPLLSSGIVLILGIGITVKGFASIAALPTIGSSTLLAAGIGLSGIAVGAGFAIILTGRRSPVASTSTSLVPLDQLPPRYRDGHAVSSAPMGAAPLVFDGGGDVAWDQIWGHDETSEPFCDLALAGGPPHRGTMLEPGTDAATTTTALAHVRAEMGRGLHMVTGLEVTEDVPPGWIGLVCHDPKTAAWIAMAIEAENVRTRQEGSIVLLPTDATFTTDKEVKNVVTATAKTWHYWSEHAADLRNDAKPVITSWRLRSSLRDAVAAFF